MLYIKNMETTITKGTRVQVNRTGDIGVVTERINMTKQERKDLIKQRVEHKKLQEAAEILARLRVHS